MKRRLRIVARLILGLMLLTYGLISVCAIADAQELTGGAEYASNDNNQSLPEGYYYVGYRDVTDMDVNGVYWDDAREITKTRGNDVQAHIDSHKWTDIAQYFNGAELMPGQSIDVGYVFSFDGAKIDNMYQLTHWTQVTWMRGEQIPPEPQSEPEPDPIPYELEVVEEMAEPQPEKIVVRCTGYTADEGYTGITKSGLPVQEGVLAGPEAWLGRTCELFGANGNSLGTYLFADTGNPKYVNETRIDRWFSSNAELRTWQKTVGDYVVLEWR